MKPEYQFTPGRIVATNLEQSAIHHLIIGNWIQILLQVHGKELKYKVKLALLH